MSEIIMLAVLALVAVAVAFLVPALDGRKPWASDTPRFYQITTFLVAAALIAFGVMTLLGYTG